MPASVRLPDLRPQVEVLHGAYERATPVPVQFDDAAADCADLQFRLRRVRIMSRDALGAPPAFLQELGRLAEQAGTISRSMEGYAKALRGALATDAVAVARARTTRLATGRTTLDTLDTAAYAEMITGHLERLLSAIRPITRYLPATLYNTSLTTITRVQTTVAQLTTQIATLERDARQTFDTLNAVAAAAALQTAAIKAAQHGVAVVEAAGATRAVDRAALVQTSDIAARGSLAAAHALATAVADALSPDGAPIAEPTPRIYPARPEVPAFAPVPADVPASPAAVTTASPSRRLA